MIKNWKGKIWGTFELKVILLTVLLTIATGISFYYIAITQFSNVIISELKENAKSTLKYAEEAIDPESFLKLNTVEDEESVLYKTTQKELNVIRQIANIRYLYTAKRNSEGNLVYVVDGLDLSAEDFRHIGMPIEEEIMPDLERCLEDEDVLGEQILNTDWGIVYVNYFPMHNDKGEVIGAIGMEFDVEYLFLSFADMRVVAVTTLIILVLLFSLLGIFVLRKISEPFYKKIAFHDSMTKMGNRYKFELEFNKLRTSLQKNDLISIVIYDLNELKGVNDQFGHLVGDRYIKAAALFIQNTFKNWGTCYRIGGDEFVVLITGREEREIKEILQNSNNERVFIIKDKNDEELAYGVAYGYSCYEPDIDHDLKNTFNRADDNMYDCKKKMQLNT